MASIPSRSSVEALRVDENCVGARLRNLILEQGEVDLRLAKVFRGGDQVEAVAQAVGIAVACSIVDALVELDLAFGDVAGGLTYADQTLRLRRADDRVEAGRDE